MAFESLPVCSPSQTHSCTIYTVTPEMVFRCMYLLCQDCKYGLVEVMYLAHRVLHHQINALYFCMWNMGFMGFHLFAAVSTAEILWVMEMSKKDSSTAEWSTHIFKINSQSFCSDLDVYFSYKFIFSKLVRNATHAALHTVRKFWHVFHSMFSPH